MAAEKEIYSLDFSVGGQRYSIRTSDDRAGLEKIIADADKRVSELTANRLTYQQALVVTLLDYGLEKEKEIEKASDLRANVGEYLKDAEEAKLECERLRREIDRLKKKLINDN